MQQATEPQWISYINALSTTAVAAFALVELVRTWVERNRPRQTAHARIAATGATLHRMIERWNKTVSPHGRTPDSGDGADLAEWLAIVKPEFPEAEDLLLRAVDDPWRRPGRSRKECWMSPFC